MLEKRAGQLEDKIVSIPDFEELDADHFYTDLDRLVRTANRTVKLMYFGKRSPRTGTFRRQERNYVEMILRHPRDRRDIYFQRIILNTPSNVEWATENMNALGNLANFSLAIYNPRGTEPILSIQLIDDEHVFIVDPLPGGLQNIKYLYAKSHHANYIFDKYYQAVWEQSIVLVDCGTKNEQAMQDLGLISPPQPVSKMA